MQYYYITHRHLSLAGNSLLCEGATELLKALVIVCESDADYIPPLARLNLQDNGIDCSGPKGMIEPVMFIRTLKRYSIGNCGSQFIRDEKSLGSRIF